MNNILEQKGALTFRSKINFRISGINISLTSSDPTKSFSLNQNYQNFIRVCKCPDINIRICYSNVPKIKFSRDNFFAQVDGWWSFYRIKGKKIFLLPPVKNRKRDFAILRKKVLIGEKGPAIIASKERSDFNSVNVLLPLPRRLAIFESNCRKGTIYVDIPASELTVSNPVEFPLLYLVLSEALYSKRGIILHACGIIKNNKECYLFLGHSGDGKSTMAHLWRDDAVLLNDDRVPIRKIGDSFFAYAVPGYSENPCSYNSTTGIEITKIFFLQKDIKNKIEHLSNIQALSMLIAYTPAVTWDNIIFKQNIDLLKQIAREIPCYLLHFFPDKKIIKLLLELK